MPKLRTTGLALVLTATMTFSGVLGTSLAGATTPTIPPRPTNPTEKSLSDYLLELSDTVYQQYAAQLRALKDQLDANTTEMSTLMQELREKYQELEATKDPAAQEKISAAIEALQKKLTQLQNKNESLSDDLKQKNFQLQHLLDIMTQVHNALDKIIKKTAQHIGR